MKKFIITVALFFIGNFCLALDVYKLPNEQTLVVEPINTNPIVTIDTWIRTGSINENDSNNGISHFLEHLFFKGTEKHPTGEFDKILESKGGVTNAATSKDFTHYYITIPSKYFDLALEMHSDMLLNPQIPRKELEKERKVVIEEISKDKDSPSRIVYENLNSLIYTTHPYKRTVIGTKEIIERLTREEILDYYHKYYNPSNMITVISGDVNSQEVYEKVKATFCSNNVSTPKHRYIREKQITTPKEKIEYSENTKSGYMQIGFKGTPANDKDTYALDVLATILGDGRTSRLYQTIKDQKQLAFSIYASNSSYKDDSIFLINSNFSPENIEKLKAAIFQEILNIQTKGVEENDVKLAQKIIERDTYFSRESITNIATEIGYSMILSDKDINFYTDYLKNIDKVTPQDVQNVARKYLSQNKSATSIVLPKGFQLSKPYEETKNIVPKLISKDSTTEKYSIPNGATMLVTPNSANDIVAISIFIKGGELVEQRAGIADLTSSVMTKGTKKYSSVEFAKEAEEDGIRISTNSSVETFGVDILTTKPQVEKALDLLNEIVNNATFDDFEIEKSKKNQINMLKMSLDAPISKALDGYKTLIFEGSKYSISNNALQNALIKVTREDILEYYNKIFNPKNIVISIDGDIDKNYIANEMNQIFKTKNEQPVVFSKYSIPALTAPKTKIQKVKDVQTSWIILGWQTAGLLSEKDYATLKVIDSIMGTGMSSRLFKNLRDQEGLAYQIGTGYSPNLTKGSFYAYIGTNPKNTQYAKQKMLNEVFKLKTEFVGDKELQEAKDQLTGHYLLSLETNMDKASQYGWFEVSGRGYIFKDKYEKLINSVTASDIIEVANKYFSDNFVTSIVEPQ